MSPTLSARLKSNEFHIEKLKPAFQRNVPFSVDQKIPLPPNKDGEFYIEKVLASRPKGKSFEYLIKWDGYTGIDSVEWVHERNMSNAREYVDEYWEHVKRGTLEFDGTETELPVEKEKRRSTRNNVRLIGAHGVYDT